MLPSEAMNRSEAYKVSPQLCGACKESLPFEKARYRNARFCNRKCSAKINAVTRTSAKSKYFHLCPDCSDPINSKNKRCKKCSDIFLNKRKVTRVCDARTPQTRRKILLHTRGNKCENCCLTVWCGSGIPLEVEHVDGNSDNNDEKNLKLLCPNCHAQTPTYKSKNKYRGSKRQKMRMKRYREGKTY
jgi:hypothetical protein